MVSAATGDQFGELTGPTNQGGYRRLVALADEHAGARVWSLEGVGGCGAGVAWYLTAAGGGVAELDPPGGGGSPRR